MSRRRVRRIERKARGVGCRACGFGPNQEIVYVIVWSAIPPPHIAERVARFHPEALAEMAMLEAALRASEPTPEPLPPCALCARPREHIIAG